MATEKNDLQTRDGSSELLVEKLNLPRTIHLAPLD